MPQLFQLVKDGITHLETEDVKLCYTLRDIIGGAIVGVVNNVPYIKAALKHTPPIYAKQSRKYNVPSGDYCNVPKRPNLKLVRS